MIATTANWRDVQKYYEQSYIKIHGYGDKLFYVDRVRETVVTGTDEEGTLFELYLSNSDPFQMDYVLPHRSLFQHGDDAYLLRRIPARQYRRGLCSDNVSILNITTGESVPVDFTLLKAYVGKQSFPLLSEVLSSTDRRSIALTPRMSFARAGRELRIDATKIGLVLMSGKIKVTRPIFLKEVQKYLSDNSLSYEVVV